jgi:hypothetical protein
VKQSSRHPEVLASSASLEGWMQQRCLLPSFEARKKERAPQDDDGASGYNALRCGSQFVVLAMP